MNYQELQEAKQKFILHTSEKEYKPLYKAREEFVKKFTPAKIASMKIDEYVQGKQSKTSFCYILERTLKNLGNIEGQYATKFGVWYSSKEQKYKTEKRQGDNYIEVFHRIRKSILELLEAGEKKDYKRIIRIPINSIVKGKILSTYYPEDYLNIFSKDHLDHYLKTLDLDTADLMKKDVLYKREALLEFKNKDKDMRKWSVNMFAVFLWTHYPKSNEVAVVSDEKEIEFPTIDKDNISFVDLQLKNGPSTPHTRSHSGQPSPDYEKEAKKYKKLGDRGEYVVIQAEVSRLREELSISEPEAKELIKWVSRESDAFGFDIQSVNKDKTPRYIEVKATQRKVGDMDFYYTENEYETAKKYGKDYYIYVVYEILTPHPKIWAIKNPFDDSIGIKMKPVKYKVQLSTSMK